MTGNSTGHAHDEAARIFDLNNNLDDLTAATKHILDAQKMLEYALDEYKSVPGKLYESDLIHILTIEIHRLDTLFDRSNKNAVNVGHYYEKQLELLVNRADRATR